MSCGSMWEAPSCLDAVQLRIWPPAHLRLLLGRGGLKRRGSLSLFFHLQSQGWESLRLGVSFVLFSCLGKGPGLLPACQEAQRKAACALPCQRVLAMPPTLLLSSPEAPSGGATDVQLVLWAGTEAEQLRGRTAGLSVPTCSLPARLQQLGALRGLARLLPASAAIPQK